MKKISKVVFLIHKPPPRHGTAVVGEQIERYISKESNYFFDLSLSEEYSDVGRISTRKIKKLVWLVFNYFGILLFHNVDRVYIGISLKGLGLWRDLLFIAIAKLTRTNLVVHAHTRVAKDLRLPRKYLLKWIFWKSKCIVPSSAVKRDLMKLEICREAFVVPNGVEPAVLQGAQTSSYVEKTCILYYSSFSIDKGIYVFLDIISQSYFDDDIHVMIFGTEFGVDTSMIYQRAIELGLASSLEICVKPTEEQKKDMWQRADILIFPSLDEAFGMVCIEAFSAGVLVIASNEGGIADIVTNGFNGLTFEAGNSSDGFQKLQLALKDKALSRRLAERGNLDYHSKYRVSTFITNITNLLQ